MPHNKKIGPEQPGYYAESQSEGGDERHPQVEEEKKKKKEEAKEGE